MIVATGSVARGAHVSLTMMPSAPTPMHTVSHQRGNSGLRVVASASATMYVSRPNAPTAL